MEHLGPWYDAPVSHHETRVVALPSGAKKYSSTGPKAAEIHAEWSKMTPAEKAAASAGPLQELQEAKEFLETSRHNTAIAAFHDVQQTLSAVHEEVHDLFIVFSNHICLIHALHS